MKLYRRPRSFGDGLDILQPEVVLIAPVEEAFYRARVRHPGVAVADGRGKEFDKATASMFALSADNRRQPFEPGALAAYVEELGTEIAKPSVKQHLAAIRQLFDYLVTGGVLVATPAGSVRGPKFVVTRGKTLVLSGAEMRQLLK